MVATSHAWLIANGPYHVVIRAKIVLLAAAGWEKTVIADRLDVPVQLASGVAVAQAVLRGGPRRDRVVHPGRQPPPRARRRLAQASTPYAARPPDGPGISEGRT